MGDIDLKKTHWASLRSLEYLGRARKLNGWTSTGSIIGIIWLISDTLSEWNIVGHYSANLGFDSSDFKSSKSFFKRDSPDQKTRIWICRKERKIRFKI